MLCMKSLLGRFAVVGRSTMGYAVLQLLLNAECSFCTLDGAKQSVLDHEVVVQVV